MTGERKRCAHCGSSYIYQGSGSDIPELNSSEWCSDCYKIVIAALSVAPRKYCGKYRDIQEIPEFSEITLPTLLEWESARTAQRKAANTEGKPECAACSFRSMFAVNFTGIFPGLYDHETGEIQNGREVVAPSGRFQGVRFKLATWKTKPEYSIEIEMEWDLVESAWTGRRW